ncbi:MAG: cobalt-precorrin-5B (C(1))-methyltransferase CbiD [Actinomycetia bacterium]|nr:cobalt-precorrin-5B (C(1))-methyltransferase CbiD [Actinomycetes bacterium]
MKPLRSGVTTGLCAAAAAKAATFSLLTGREVHQVEIQAITGEVFKMEVTDTIIENNGIACAVRKDAGDDPDVTNGLKVFASVEKIFRDEIVVDGGEGIGRVTKPGLKIPVGQAAINPVPLNMITMAIKEICGLMSYQNGIKAVIFIPGGEQVAKRTMNGRLGIVGGLSILGTTGIVEPMSKQAIVDTIKAEIDVHLAGGKTNLLIAPGNYGKQYAQEQLGLDIKEAIKCSNFIGETLDYLCQNEVQGIMLIGHAGKLVKLAGGIMNTHSSMADCRMEIIVAHAALAGADRQLIAALMECVSTNAAIELLNQAGIGSAVWGSIGQKISFYLRQRTRGSMAVEYVVFTQEHGTLIHERLERAAATDQ